MWHGHCQLPRSLASLPPLGPRRGGALVRTVNGVGAVLCVAVSPLWVNLIMSGANSPDALWALIGVPLEFAACIGYYVYTARRIG